MITPTITGNKNGIKLWEMMAASTDEEEKSYFSRLNGIASQYGKIYFTDYITQRETKRNQVIWCMLWNVKENQWEVSNLITPVGASEITKRMKSKSENNAININSL